MKLHQENIVRQQWHLLMDPWYWVDFLAVLYIMTLDIG
jgi:hypothetical protein